MDIWKVSHLISLLDASPHAKKLEEHICKAYNLRYFTSMIEDLDNDKYQEIVNYLTIERSPWKKL